MKNKAALILLSFLLTFACLFASCNANGQIFPEEDTPPNTDDYTMTIQSLEQQILELQQNQYLSEMERQEELTRLQNLLAQLKNESNQNPSDKKDPTTSQSSGKFLYTVTESKAVITGYTGKDSLFYHFSINLSIQIAHFGHFVYFEKNSDLFFFSIQHIKLPN